MFGLKKKVKGKKIENEILFKLFVKKQNKSKGS